MEDRPFLKKLSDDDKRLFRDISKFRKDTNGHTNSLRIRKLSFDLTEESSIKEEIIQNLVSKLGDGHPLLFSPRLPKRNSDSDLGGPSMTDHKLTAEELKKMRDEVMSSMDTLRIFSSAPDGKPKTMRAKLSSSPKDEGIRRKSIQDVPRIQFQRRTNFTKIPSPLAGRKELTFSPSRPISKRPIVVEAPKPMEELDSDDELEKEMNALDAKEAQVDSLKTDKEKITKLQQILIFQTQLREMSEAKLKETKQIHATAKKNITPLVAKIQSYKQALEDVCYIAERLTN